MLSFVMGACSIVCFACSGFALSCLDQAQTLAQIDAMSTVGTCTALAGAACYGFAIFLTAVRS